jgi:hypothetical protein
VVGIDPPSDLAVVKIDAENLPAASLGDSDSARVGEWSAALSNAALNCWSRARPADASISVVPRGTATAAVRPGADWSAPVTDSTTASMATTTNAKVSSRYFMSFSPRCAFPGAIRGVGALTRENTIAGFQVSDGSVKERSSSADSIAVVILMCAFCTLQVAFSAVSRFEMPSEMILVQIMQNFVDDMPLSP